MTELNEKPFWLDLDRFGDHPALLSCPGLETLNYRGLANAVHAGAGRLHRPVKALVMLFMKTRPDSIVALLSSLAAGHCVYPLNHAMPPDAVRRLVALYRPDLVLGSLEILATHGFTQDAKPFHGSVWTADRGSGPQRNLHADLALLLSTSGSLGSPKTVRLSSRNLAVNARQIAAALSIGETDVGVLSLPLAYTYGLSVLTSHLHAGAALAVDDRSCLNPGFWASCAEARVTSFPGISFTLDFLARNGRQVLPPTVRAITHSGSRLGAPAIQWIRRMRADRDLKVYKMYGMTEATARLSVLPPDDFDAHPHSVGSAVPGGSFTLDGQGQVIFRGPNVMMGYAQERSDLSRGDDLGGALATGDLGRLDAEGRLELIGRLGRFAKVLALRLDLSEIEDFFSETSQVAVTSDDDTIYIHHTDRADVISRAADRFCAEYRFPRARIALRPLHALPRSASGKILYGDLGREPVPAVE
jgi:long-subunit acyl-CoA synthetase (AMP-forming)